MGIFLEQQKFCIRNSSGGIVGLLDNDDVLSKGTRCMKL